MKININNSYFFWNKYIFRPKLVNMTNYTLLKSNSNIWLENWIIKIGIVYMKIDSYYKIKY